MDEVLGGYFAGMSKVLTEMPVRSVAAVRDAILDCWRAGGTVFLAGNGGSAATASHFACDLAKGARHDSLPRIRVVALTDNVPLMTAWGNDAAYGRIFAEQLVALVRPGDLVLVISGSGNSENVLAAAEAGRAAGAGVVAFSGRTGGKVKEVADIAVCVPADTQEEIEDAHSVITHALCVALRQALKNEASRKSMAGEVE